MKPKYQTDAQKRRERNRIGVVKDFPGLIKDGSAKTAIYTLLGDRYAISPATVRVYLKQANLVK